jgi:hypothetical protein
MFYWTLSIFSKFGVPGEFFNFEIFGGLTSPYFPCKLMGNNFELVLRRNGSMNELSNRLILNKNLFPVPKMPLLSKSNGRIASCPYLQWEKIDKLFKNENFNLVRPTPVLQFVPIENSQFSSRIDQFPWELKSKKRGNTVIYGKDALICTAL